MTDTTFKKVGASERPMYGPRKILVCGYAPKQQAVLLAFFRDTGFGEFPVVFVPGDEEGKTIGELIARAHLNGYQATAGSQRAIIVSGFTEVQLRRLLSAFREAGIPRPLMATLTPTSESWTARTLLKELSREAEAMKRWHARSKPPSPDGRKGKA